MEDKYYSRLFKLLVLLTDFYLIQVAFSMAKQLGYTTATSTIMYSSFVLIFSLLWIIAGFINETHRINRFSKARDILDNIIRTFLFHAVFMMSIIVSTDIYHFHPTFFAAVYLLTLILLMGVRIGFKLIWKYSELARIDQKKVIIVGTTRSGKALYDFFTSHDYSRYHFAGFFDDSPSQELVDPSLVKGKCTDIEEYCKRENVTEIYFALPQKDENMISSLSKFADNNFIYLRIVPEFSNAVADRYNVFLFDSIPVFTPRNEPLGNSLNAGLKRLFDIAFSMLVIVFVFPIAFPLIGLAIRLDSKGPIIFKQLRRGKSNVLFECYKFRSMKVGVNNHAQATKDDPRVTRVGKFLRKSSLDELPQFINVLLGNMSVVGPRPHVTNQDDYAKVIVKYPFRHFVTPGITGYAQVSGFRGETKETSLMEKRVEYDLKYMENWTFSLDVKIILQTIWLMFRGQNKAY